MAFGFEGNQVRLVPLEHDRHFENCLRWINDPEITEWLLIDPPMARLAEEEWFRRACSGEDRTNQHFAIETLDGIHIGTSGLHGIDHKNGFCSTGSLIGDKSHWGRGFGTDATRVRAYYIFEVLGLRMAFSGVLEGNEASLRMQAKVGYEVYGRAPAQYWKRGAYRDHILTVLTRERWLACMPSG